MDIGVTYSSNPARLIQQSGQYLSQNIREIGQQVQGTILELNTRKDIGRMAQNLSTLNVQSDAFPIQAAQVFAQHPLAAQDGRGQMVLKALGQAHGEWRKNKDLLARFDQQENMLGMRNQATLEQIAARNQATTEQIGARAAGAEHIENLRQEGRKELLDMRNTDVLGQIEARANAAATKPMTPYQQGQLSRADRKAQVDAIKTEIAEMDKNILSGERAYKDAMAREQKATDPAEKARHASDWSAVGQLTDELKKKKEERLAALRNLMAGEDSEEVLVPPGAIAPAPVVDETVAVINPSGKNVKIRRSQLEAALQNGYKQR